MIEKDDGSNGSDVVITAVVVSWNTRELTRDCLSNLLAAGTHVPLHIIVVDNASEDGSADMIAYAFPQVELVRNVENVGFGPANNIAFARARGRYLLVFNPDARLKDTHDLQRWVALMDADPQIAASGAYLIDETGRHRLGDAGFRPTWRSILGLYWFLGRLSPRRFPPYFLYQQTAESVDVDWVCGAAMLVRRKRLDDVGPFDPRVFAYGEDVEWCCRMREHGWRVVHLPRIRVMHVEGAAGRKQRAPGYSILWFRQLRALYLSYQPGQPAWVFDVILLVGLAARVLGYGVASVLRREPFYRQRIGQHLACARYLLRQGGRRGVPWPGEGAASVMTAAGMSGLAAHARDDHRS